MLNYLKKLSYTTKFSIIAFIVTLAIGLLSMGALGAVLYYSVSFMFSCYPSFNDWHGDWVWNAMILSGMLWSVGFLFSGLAWHFLKSKISSKIILSILYAFILWLWAYLIWFVLIINYLQPLS